MTAGLNFLNIDAEMVTENLDMDDCISLMRQAQIDQYNQSAFCPPRNFITLNEQDQLLIMPAGNKFVLGTKLLTLFPKNNINQLPVIQGVILLFCAQTGQPMATIDAASITAIRTAAASAAATAALANDDAAKLAIIGAGVQAKTHIDAMLRVRNIQSITIHSRTLASAEQLAAETRAQFSIRCQVEQTAEKAIRGADIVCTLTSSSEPVVKGEWLSPGCHLNLVGAHSPNMREVDSATIKLSSVFVEQLEMALVEAGDIVIPVTAGELGAEEIRGEIAEVYTGLNPGRTSVPEITLYKSLGNAVQDITAAHAVYKAVRRAAEQVGQINRTR